MKDKYRISGIIWAIDPLSLGVFRQKGEYDKYARDIVSSKIQSKKQLERLLDNQGIYTENLLEELSYYLWLNDYD